MKKIIFLLPILIVILVSCNKNRSNKYKSRFIGYVFNQNDTTAFANTKFKVYTPASSFNVTETKEFYFYTDNKGYFDITVEDAGLLAWPSYHQGAAYIGPPYFGNSKRWETDENNKIYISYFDTIYTTPYH